VPQVGRHYNRPQTFAQPFAPADCGERGRLAIARSPLKARPTILDVAQRAGVSPTTVSHVLNETRFVSPSAKAKVVAAVEDLGYRPDAAARSLRSQRRRIVGLLITNLHNRGFASFMDGLDQALAPAGFSVMVSATRGDPSKELACLAMLREQRVDGLVLAGSAGAKEDYLRRLHEEGLPMVHLNRVTQTFPIDHVTLDYRGAGRTLARHLLDLGHRCFALVGVPRPEAQTHPFVEGWLEVAREAGLPPGATQSFPAVSREEVGHRVAREVLASATRPTAVVATNLPVAIGTLLACQELGLKIPEDLSIATLGNAGWAQLVAPPLTAIPDALPEWGALAARFLLERIQGTYAGPPRLDVRPADLIVRGSTGPSPK
jgi:LacI family transcriptional regulator